MRNKKGFTLIELIVALSLAMMLTVAVMNILISSINADSKSTFKAIATNIGREGIEVVLNIRDSNWIMSERWDNGLCLESDDICSDTTAILIFDTSNNTWQLDFGSDGDIETINTCSENNDCVIYRNLGNKSLTQSRTELSSLYYEKTLFNRLITIEIIDENHRKIISEVLWNDRGEEYKIKLERDIYDWR